MAVKLGTSDAGAVGGDTWVTLFASHGFDSHLIYTGNWGSVDPKNVHWVNDSELEILYDYGMYTCRSVPPVIVRCVARSTANR